MQKITPFLWFDTQAEEAANYYVSIFRNSAINKITYYKSGSPSPIQEGVLTVGFTLDGVEFAALNGGPEFQFSQAHSYVINCQSQEEIDYYWNKLSEGGEIQACGWLKDKYGIAWQVTPVRLLEMISDPDPVKSQAAFSAMLNMIKLDLPELERAYNNA